MGKDSAPPIDYAAQAAAQGQANKETAEYNNNANRVDQYSPTGSLTWGIRPGADPKNPQPGDYIQTTRYSPEQQALADRTNAIQTQLLGSAQSGLGRVDASMASPFETAGLPGLSGAPGIQQSTTPGAGITTSAPQAGQLTSHIDTTGLPQIGGDYGAQRQQVVDSLMSRYKPDLERGTDTLRTRLANQGVEQGSTAYDRAMELDNRKYNDATAAAQLAGGQEQSRLEQLALAGRSAMFGEGAANASLNNSAQGTAYQQGLAGAQFGNQAQAQAFGQQSSADQVANALAMRNAAFGNQTRSQGIQEQAYLRSLPLNEINSLRTGNQMSAPSFSNYYTSGSTSPPIMDAAMAQGTANQVQAAQNNASTNAAVGAGVGLASSTASYWMPALLAAFSDLRLKQNIRVIGRHPAGVDRVRWDWKDGTGSDFGVIAQELQKVRPDAVVQDASGFLMVQYAKIGGR